MSPNTVAEALWFGPEERPLAGWLHLPSDGLVKGGVVLCLPFGLEATSVYYACRLLADDLAGRGLAVLRFDYDGTGDSSGGQADADRVAAWDDSVRMAFDVLAGQGVGSMALVGCRLGALFAATEASRRGGVDALVLWDPCLSGSAHLREEEALARLRRRNPVPLGTGAADVLGTPHAAETLEALRSLHFDEIALPLARRTLVLTKENRRVPARLRDHLEGTEVDWSVAVGQADLLDSELQATPTETLATIAHWLDSVLSSPPVAVEVPDRTTAVVARGADGEEVVEQLTRLGPAGLFGVVSEPARGADGPTLVFVNDGTTPHIGQHRLWVELARDWAPRGFRVVRFDLSGNGDSPVRPGQVPHVVRSPQAFDDLDDVRSAVAPEDPSNVVLIGLCSGAYQAVESALAAPVRGICAINPAFVFEEPEADRLSPHARQARQSTPTWLRILAERPVAWVSRRKSAGPERWVRVFATGGWPAELHRVFPRTPDLAWRIVNRLLIRQPTAATLESLDARGVETVLVCGGEDFGSLMLGARDRLNRLFRSGALELISLPDLDHAGLVADQRDLLRDALTTYLLRRYRPDGAVTPA